MAQYSTGMNEKNIDQTRRIRVFFDSDQIHNTQPPGFHFLFALQATVTLKPVQKMISYLGTWIRSVMYVAVDCNAGLL